MTTISKRSGSVLIIVLWTVALLAVLEVGLALRMNAPLHLIGRLRERNQLRWASYNAWQRIRAVVMEPERRTAFREGKLPPTYWRWAPLDLVKNVDETTLHFLVQWKQHIDGSWRTGDGLSDEDGKIPVAWLDAAGWRRLIDDLFPSWTTPKRRALADAIYDYMHFGESTPVGLGQRRYYESTEAPYAAKKKPIEWIEELSLIQHMTDEAKERIASYVTVLHQEPICLNTTQGPVLHALGLSQPAAAWLMAYRNGDDQIPFTEDDRWFRNDADVWSVLKNMKDLDPMDIKTLTRLLRTKRLGFQPPRLFSGSMHVGPLKPGGPRMTIRIVLDHGTGRLVRWREAIEGQSAE